jgi:hypothetical protein
VRFRHLRQVLVHPGIRILVQHQHGAGHEREDVGQWPGQLRQAMLHPRRARRPLGVAGQHEFRGRSHGQPVQRAQAALGGGIVDVERR